MSVRGAEELAALFLQSTRFIICPEPPRDGGEVCIGAGGAVAGNTQACLDGSYGGLDDSSPLHKKPVFTQGYIVCQSDRKPVGCVRRDWTNARRSFPSCVSIGP